MNAVKGRSLEINKSYWVSKMLVIDALYNFFSLSEGILVEIDV